MKKMTLKKTLALVMSTAMILGLAACGSEDGDADTSANASSEDGSDEPDGEFSGTIKFGVVAPITGAHAEYGQGFDAATRIAADEINAAGGINGKKVVIEVQDSAADAKTSSDIFTRYAEDDEILAVIGDFTSSCCLANAPIADEYGLVQISPTASDPSYTATSDYCFSVMYNQRDAAPWYASAMFAHYLGTTDYVCMYLNTDWGISTYGYVSEALEAQGIECLASEAYAENETDFSSVISKLSAEGSDTIVILDQGNLPTIINQIKSSGWDVKITSIGPGASDQILDQCGENANGLILATPSYITADNPATADFYEKFYAINGCAPTDHAVCAYNCVYMLKAAIENLGDEELTRASLRDSLATATYDGMTGHVEFNSEGGCDREQLIMGVEDGKWVIEEDYGYE